MTCHPERRGPRSARPASRRTCISPSTDFTLNTLVQKRLPIVRHSSRRPGHRLTFRMRVRRSQLRACDHRPRFVIVEPILTRLEAGNDRMPRLGRVLRCMLARRTVAATDVSALRAPPQMQPPAIRRRQAFHAPIAARLCSGVNSTQALFHFPSLFRVCCSQKNIKPPVCRLCTIPTGDDPELDAPDVRRSVCKKIRPPRNIPGRAIL